MELALQQYVLVDVGLEDLAANPLVLRNSISEGALLAGELTASHEAVFQNLFDVDLAVTGATARRVVDCVGVEDDVYVRPRCGPAG